VMQMFIQYSWPGNLREFKNVIRRCALLTDKGLINASSLPFEISNGESNNTGRQPLNINDLGKRSLDLKDSASKAEYETIMHVLKEVNFNKTKAAEVLKIDRKTLYNKIKSYEDSQL
jgi:two-component system, NtrC family, response regulator HydG